MKLDCTTIMSLNIKSKTNWSSAQANLGPQQVARDETLELLLGSAPCDSSSLIIPCTT